MRSGGALFLTAVMLLCGERDTRAQDAPVADPDTDAARRHFERGSALYSEGRYREAIREFETAQQIKPLPDFEYNVGRSYDRLEEWDRAADAYERYLSQEPNARGNVELRGRIQVLRARARPSSVPAASPKRPRSGWLLAAIVVAPLALATVAAGTGVYVAAARGHDELKSSCAPNCDPSRWSGYRNEAYAGYALWAVGGALAAVDVALWVLQARRRSGEKRAWILPTAGGVVLGGRF